MCSSAYQLLGETPLQCWCPQNLRTVLTDPQQSALFGALTRRGSARHGSQEVLQPGSAAPESRAEGDATPRAAHIPTGSIGCDLGHRALGSVIERTGARCALRATVLRRDIRIPTRREAGPLDQWVGAPFGPPRSTRSGNVRMMGARERSRTVTMSPPSTAPRLAGRLRRNARHLQPSRCPRRRAQDRQVSIIP